MIFGGTSAVRLEPQFPQTREAGGFYHLHNFIDLLYHQIPMPQRPLITCGISQRTQIFLSEPMTVKTPLILFEDTQTPRKDTALMNVEV